MAWSYVIDREKKLVISASTGMFTSADADEHQKALLADPDFDPDFSQLMDFSAVTQIPLDSGTIARLADRKVFSARSRRAIVVPSTLGYGLARMFTTYREIAGGEEKIEIFTDRNAALLWLEQQIGD
jgi:hypothetical protein